MSRDRAALALTPSSGSFKRIQKDIQATKETERQESKYRLISNLRPKCDDQGSSPGNSQPASPVTEQKRVLEKEEASSCEKPDSPINAGGNFQVFDMVHEAAEKEKGDFKVHDDIEPEETYDDDEDDENEENNWRNDYPDEEDSDSEEEERYMGYYEDSDEEGEDSYTAYKRRVMRELNEEEEHD